MRQNLKRACKSTLSIILCVMMVFSTMFVGMVTTLAAYTNEFTSVHLVGNINGTTKWDRTDYPFTYDSTTDMWSRIVNFTEQSEFKARANNAWTCSFGQDNGSNVTKAAGVYKISIADNSSNGTNLTIEEVESIALDKPEIQFDDTSIDYNEGSYVTLTVTNHGSYPVGVTYLLYKDGVDTGETFTTNTYQVTEQGSYQLKAYPTEESGLYSESTLSDAVEVTKDVQTFSVVVDDVANATVSATPTTATSDTTINVTVTPDAGFTCTGVTVTRTDDNTSFEANGSGTSYSFTMPASNVNVTANILAKEAATISVSPSDDSLGSVKYFLTDNGAYVGEQFTVTATPADGARFVDWTIEGATITKEYTNLIGLDLLITDPTVKVVANFEELPTYTVTAKSNNTSMGTVSPTTSTVHEGDTVTLTATPSGTNTFKSWTISGDDYTITSGSTSTASITLKVNSNVTATATFHEDQGTVVSGKYLVYGTNQNPSSWTSYKPIYELSDGTWVARFTSSDFSVNTNYYFALSDSTSYKNMYWLDATGSINVTTENSSLASASASEYGITENNVYTNYRFGTFKVLNATVSDITIECNTTVPDYNVVPLSNVPDGSISVYAKDGSTVEGGTNKYGETTITSGTLEGSTVADAGNYRIYYVSNEGGIITIQTEVGSSYNTAGYYVYAYVINGETVYTTSLGGGIYEATYNVPADSSNIEITPVYYNTKIEEAGDYITFFVDASELGDRWGNTIACYSYYYANGTDTSGGIYHGDCGYPGQPMLKNANGKYFTKLARYYYDETGKRTSYVISGITLNNFIEYELHADFVTDATNYQTYDYDDFKFISDPALGYDTVQFDIKYRNSTSNLSSISGTSSINISTFAGQNGWDLFTDYDKNPTDILGNAVDDSKTDPVYIVSTGNQSTSVGQWSTIWYVYDKNGNYITHGNPSNFIPRPEGTSNTDPYNAMNVEAYLNCPTYICFESEMSYSGNSGVRSDGRWYYKNSKLSQVTVDVKVQYSDDEGVTWSYDTTGTKGIATIDGYTEITYNESNIEAQINAVAGNGYMFVEWGIVDDNGENYKTISTSINDVLLLDTNYHIVARFLKVDDESLIISHEKYAGPGAVGGYGFYYASAVLYHKDGTTTNFAKSQSAIPVAINYLTDEKLVVTLETVCSGRNTFIDYYEYANGTYQIIGPEDVDNYGSRTPAPYTFEISVADICDEYGNLSIQALNYYSDIASVTAKATFNYKYYNRFNEERSYTVQITLSEEYLTKYPDYSLDNEDGYDLIYKNAPAIDDIYKDCKWQIADQTVAFNGTTATLWAVQTTKQFDVTINDGINIEQIARVYLNDYIAYDAENDEIYGTIDTDGIVFYTAPKNNGDAKFSHWLVEEDGREVAKCYSQDFNLRIAGNYTITAIYGTKSESLTISDANYTREQFTDSTGSTTTDYLYADFIVAYMDSNGVLLNSGLGDGYKTGLVVEFDKYIKVNVEDVAGGKLTDTQKIKFTDEQNLDDATIKSFVESGNSSYVFDSDGDDDKNRVLYNFEIDNANYNNKNRLDFYVRFKNTAANKQYVMKAYYYVIDPAGNYSITEPVYFYLYDIGNSVSVTE